MKKFTNKNFSRQKFITLTTRKENSFKRIRRLYLHKLHNLNSNFMTMLEVIENVKLKVFIRVRPNNIFFTLKDIELDTVLANKSAGLYKIQVSKKSLRYNVKILLQFFFKDIENYFKKEKNFLVEIIAGIKIRRLIIKFLKQKVRKKNMILILKEKKCFNGCTPPKKKRKKRLGLRIFK